MVDLLKRPTTNEPYTYPLRALVVKKTTTEMALADQSAAIVSRH